MLAAFIRSVPILNGLIRAIFPVYTLRLYDYKESLCIICCVFIALWPPVVAKKTRKNKIENNNKIEN